jgi:hypothetical protein
VRLSFESTGEINSFSDKPKLREFVTSRPTLQDMLKKKKNFQREGKVYRSEIQIYTKKKRGIRR